MRQAQKKRLCEKKSAVKGFRRLRTATAVVGGSRKPLKRLDRNFNQQLDRNFDQRFDRNFREK